MHAGAIYVSAQKTTMKFNPFDREPKPIKASPEAIERVNAALPSVVAKLSELGVPVTETTYEADTEGAAHILLPEEYVAQAMQYAEDLAASFPNAGLTFSVAANEGFTFIAVTTK